MARRPDEITNVIRHHWDSRASGFDDETGHGLVDEAQRAAWHELLGGLVGPEPLHALDVGCGTGFLALRLAELGHTVTGVDLAPRMIERARAKAEQSGLALDLRVGNAADLDLPDESFDLVVARHVIWNLPDPAAGVAEWLRVLRPGGRLMLIEGKWAENEELARRQARRGSRLATRFVETVGGASARALGSYPRRLVPWRYHRIEAALPFSGGPTAERLAGFLQEHGVAEPTVEELMDPVLWGETLRFPRYVVVGSRPAVSR